MPVFLYQCTHAHTTKQKTQPQNKALLTYCCLSIPLLSLAVKNSLLTVLEETANQQNSLITILLKVNIDQIT